MSRWVVVSHRLCDRNISASILRRDRDNGLKRAKHNPCLIAYLYMIVNILSADFQQ